MRLFGPEVQELLELKLVKHHASQEEALPPFLVDYGDLDRR